MKKLAIFVSGSGTNMQNIINDCHNGRIPAQAHLVIAEMVPKALALQSAERTAMLVSPAIEAIEKAIVPLVIALDALRALTVRAIGIRGEVAEEERYHSTEELQLIIQESQEEGLLRGESGRILRELFEFGDLKAWQVMVPRVHLVAVPIGSTADSLRDIVRTSLEDATGGPVSENP